MERTFTEQEEYLASLASIEYTQNKKSMKDGSIEASSPPHSEDQLRAKKPNEDRLVTDGFGKLLKHWRRKLLQTLITKSQLQRELEGATHEINRNQ